MATSTELSTDWQKSAGDFCCTICGRKRLPASEFSKKQVEQALENLKKLPGKDIRSGPDIQQVLFLSAVCKKCTEEKEAKEQAEAQARREEKQAAISDAVVGQPEQVSVEVSERPMGMAACKVDSSGFVVLKVTEGKPAAKAGIRPGWKVREVGGSSCEGLDMEAVQSLLKSASLPATIVFDSVPSGADFCTACQKVLPAPAFSRKMRTKPPDKRRCSECVESADGDGKTADAETSEVAAQTKPTTALGELQQLCADSAKEAEAVTGLKAVRGGGRRGGRGRGRH